MILHPVLGLGIVCASEKGSSGDSSLHRWLVWTEAPSCWKSLGSLLVCREGGGSSGRTASGTWGRTCCPCVSWGRNCCPYTPWGPSQACSRKSRWGAAPARCLNWPCCTGPPFWGRGGTDPRRAARWEWSGSEEWAWPGRRGLLPFACSRALCVALSGLWSSSSAGGWGRGPGRCWSGVSRRGWPEWGVGKGDAGTPPPVAVKRPGVRHGTCRCWIQCHVGWTGHPQGRGEG